MPSTDARRGGCTHRFVRILEPAVAAGATTGPRMPIGVRSFIQVDCTNAISAYFVPPLAAFDRPPSVELMEFATPAMDLVTPAPADPRGFVDCEPFVELVPCWESGAPSEGRNTLSLGPAF